MKKFILIVAFTFSVHTSLSQESNLPVFVTDSLKKYIARGMAKWEIPGLSVAIVKDGEVVFMKGFGVTNIITSEPVDENTLFMIGSTTKTFTATAIVILQEEGKLDLDDKVQKWMPEFKLKNQLASKEVNISDILSHRIGFEANQGLFAFWNSNLSRAEIIQKMGLIDATYGFRTRFGYCNAAFLTAGELIHRIAGKSWEETVKEKILTPLNMNRTLVLSEDFKKVQNKASPYTLVDNVRTEISIINTDNLAPAVSISSSGRDMTAWLLAHLNNGKVGNEQAISNKAIQALRKPYTIIGMDIRNEQLTHFSLYGLGLRIEDRNGKLIYLHTGRVPGFASSWTIMPEENLGIVLLTNADYSPFLMNLRNEILDAFLGLPYQGYSEKSFRMLNQNKMTLKSGIDSLRNIVRLNNKPNLCLEDYSGTYTNEVYGKIEIKLEAGKLNMYFSHHPNLIGKLEHLKNDEFLCTYSDPTYGVAKIPFMIDNDMIKTLTLRVAAEFEPSPYIFVKEN